MKVGIRVTGVVLAALAGLLIAGCGGSDAPEDVVDEFFQATADSDAEAFCATLSEASQTQAAETEDVETCEEGAEKAFGSGDFEAAAEMAGDVEVGEATIDGDSATVTATSGDVEEEVPLVKEDDEWKVELGG